MDVLAIIGILLLVLIVFTGGGILGWRAKDYYRALCECIDRMRKEKSNYIVERSWVANYAKTR